MENVKQWYYRGSLKSCNYSCSYCPFSKNPKPDSIVFEKDEQSLIKFTDYIVNMDKKESCAIQIVPYGEALIHKYYWREMAKLSKDIYVDAVGAQSNLSFNIYDMISEYTSCGGKIEKLRLWCTFHSQMTDVKSFALQCKKLTKYGINYCVGAVGNPEYINDILNLRKELDKIERNIYMWINKMDGLKRKYTDFEKEKFLEIDEYFESELKFHKADITRCMRSCFVESDGQMYHCNINKQSIGNLYHEQNGFQSNIDSECHRKRCSCYLAYCNRNESDLIFFNPYPAFRIPKYPKAVFFDIDGTLVTEGNRRISKEVIEKLKNLAVHSRLFAATSLPYTYAAAKLNPVMDIFNGGVFAGGGVCIVKNADIYKGYTKEFVIENDTVKNLNLECIKEHSEKYGYKVKLYRSGTYNSLNSCKKQDTENKECEKSEDLYIKITLVFKKSSIKYDNNEKKEDISACGQNACHMLEYMKQVAVKLGIIKSDIGSKNYENNFVFISNGVKVTFEENCIQIISDMAGKKEGIIYICDREGYKKEDIAVFGNSENDISMLKYFPFSVAVNPVSDDVKNAAAYII